MKGFSTQIKKLIVLSLLGLAIAPFALGASSSGSKNFAGRITETQECTCSEGSQVTIDGGSGHNSQFSGTYLYLPGTTRLIGKSSNVTSGKKIIGKYTSGGECLIEGDPCTTLPISKGTMQKAITNQFIAGIVAS